MTGNLQADGVQSRQTLFVRYCLKYFPNLPVDLSSGDTAAVRSPTGGTVPVPVQFTVQFPAGELPHCPAAVPPAIAESGCSSMAIPHKDCETDASSNFLSDETKSGVNT